MEILNENYIGKISKHQKMMIGTCFCLLITLGTPNANADENSINSDIRWNDTKGGVESIEKNKLENTITKVYPGDDWEEKYEKSTKYTPIKELKFFLEFFGIDKKLFSAKVREIQDKHGLKFDGILGRETSKVLFLKYYFPELENTGYQSISKKMRQIHQTIPEGKIADKNILCQENNNIRELLNIEGCSDIEREKVSEADKMKLRYIIYKEMHKKHHEINLFDKRVLWGYGDINFDEPVYPFINPEIQGVPDSLEDAKNIYGNLVKRITGKNGIIVGKDDSGKYVLVFYRDNKRFLTTYVSPGSKHRKTPVSSLHEVRRHDKYHRSKKYKNAAMSYAVWLSGGFFFHNGVTTGYGKSHGCIRMPMMYAKILHEETIDLKHMPFVFQPKVKFKKEESNDSERNIEIEKLKKGLIANKR